MSMRGKTWGLVPIGPATRQGRRALREGTRNINNAPGLRPRARCDVSCKTCVHYLAKGHTGKGLCQLYDFWTFKKWVCDSWKGLGAYAEGQRNRRRRGRRSTKRPFTEWRLGGNMVVMGYVRPSDGASVVWYPENMTGWSSEPDKYGIWAGPAAQESDPTVAIFAADDEEWTRPLLWRRADSLAEAVAILDLVEGQRNAEKQESTIYVQVADYPTGGYSLTAYWAGGDSQDPELDMDSRVWFDDGGWHSSKRAAMKAGRLMRDALRESHGVPVFLETV